MTSKRWQGRFSKATAQIAERFTASVDVDRELWREDIDASIAHARMLGRLGIIPSDAASRIIGGLGDVAQEIEAGGFQWREELEDVHGNIEARLAEVIGVEVAGHLHTGRSRNDQVATDLRLWLKRRLPDVEKAIAGLQGALVSRAEEHADTILPGYTHLQRAQPVTLAHHLLAYFEMLQRDRRRFALCLDAVDELVLGSGALAGAGYELDRQAVADELGFARVSVNSLDAVADRDFVVDVQAASATCMVHLSRLAEEIVLWTASEFGFATLDDAYATGSSIMPQKKNPDVAELVRGRAGRVFGNLAAILTTLKGLPLSYDRDLQEDKAGLFDSVKTVTSCLEAMTGMVKSIGFDNAAMERAASDPALLATDFADYLVRRGAPFSEAHTIVGRLVRMAEDSGRALTELSLEDMRSVSALFDEDVLRISAQSSIEARNLAGGTGPDSVRVQLTRARQLLGEA
jgi:argininosuccinate lyase